MLQGSAACYIARLLQADCVPCKPLRLEVHQPFNGKCHDMAKRDMRFLDMHRHLAWNGEKHIGKFRQLAAAIKACSDHFSRPHHRFATVCSSLQFHLGRGCKEGVNI